MTNIEQAGLNVMLGCVVMAAGVLFGLQIAPKIKHSPLQPVEQINLQYDECKAEAPAGFDCAAVFLMVSEDYIKEVVNDDLGSEYDR